jgi:putative Mn2+ efflux pump MntP
MPLIGVALGLPLGRAIGSTAQYVAAAFVVALGVYLLVEDDDEDGARLIGMTDRGMLGAFALGVSISLDELAIGFSAGLLRAPLLPMVVAIGLQAFVITQIGIRLGGRVGQRWREISGRIAGVALIALGLILVLLRA